MKWKTFLLFVGLFQVTVWIISLVKGATLPNKIHRLLHRTIMTRISLIVARLKGCIILWAIYWDIPSIFRWIRSSKLETASELFQIIWGKILGLTQEQNDNLVLLGTLIEAPQFSRIPLFYCIWVTTRKTSQNLKKTWWCMWESFSWLLQGATYSMLTFRKL